MTQDRADLRPVVVAVVQRLDEDDAQLDLEGPALVFAVGQLVTPDPPSRLDQVIRASRRVLTQYRQSWEWVALSELWFVCAKPPRVPLLGRQHVLKRRCDRPVRSGDGQAELLDGQLCADVKQVLVRPLVISESLDQRSQSQLILDT